MSVPFSAIAGRDWINLTADKISCTTWKYSVSVNWDSNDLPDGNTRCKITLTTDGRVLELNVTARRMTLNPAKANHFVESTGEFSMPAQPRSLTAMRLRGGSFVCLEVAGVWIWRTDVMQ